MSEIHTDEPGIEECILNVRPDFIETLMSEYFHRWDLDEDSFNHTVFILHGLGYITDRQREEIDIVSKRVFPSDASDDDW